jgi:hypothetical protein
MIEIYNRDPSDFNYKSDIVEITQPVEICLGQLKMFLLTNKGDVLGDPKFGLNLEDLVFSLELSEKTLRDEIEQGLRFYVPLFAQLGGYFDLKFYQGTERDIALLDFYIPQNGNESPLISLKVT